MKKALFIFVAVIAFLVINNFIPSKEECEIYNSTVRLHVIANSDSEEDQKLKLRVRDAIVEQMSTYNAKTKEEALEYINNDKDNLKKIAEECIKNEGFNNSVSIEIGEESYPTREYEDFALPAGKYTSLRVIIGEGEGQNWWCVLYPPLCTSYAIKPENDEYIDVGFTKEQFNLITGNEKEYKIKFKLLEMASQAFGFEY
ncbi:MAG: stage II sporulation protein R [Clostridia bacterium]|nr:stage II sporulation protein R [Clostridia bacterium]